MGMIDLIEVSKKYGAKEILKKVSFSIKAKDRISIIGQNGCGKSTLIKIITKEIESDEGRVVRTGNVTTQFINQNPIFPNQKVWEYMQDSITEIKELIDEYSSVSLLINENPEDEKLIAKSFEIANSLDFCNGWNIDNQVESIINNFELSHLKTRLISSLSGGEQKRVALASMMLKQSDIMFLDEPTNHLDVYMVSFLENYLKKTNKTIVFISHDRYFIDELATKIFEIENANIRVYDGGYKIYLHKKSLFIEEKTKENSNLLKLLRDEEQWLRQGVRARRKRDEGRKKRLLDLRDTTKTNSSQIKAMSSALKKEQIKAPQVIKQSKRKVLFDIKNLRLFAGDNLLIDGFDGRILQKDKIAIVGKNGCGKSTFIKALLSKVPFEGRIKVGEFNIGYFDQNRDMIDDEKNLLETFCPMGGDMINVHGKNIHVYGYLKSFLFPKELLQRKIKSLSGGEKNRVVLALLFSKQTDCLILDEPTNDLDIATINILEEYLLAYKGSVILVSHDRYFVDKIASKLLVIENKKIQESYLSYSSYLYLESSIKELDDLAKSQPKVNENIKKEKPKSIKRSLSFNEKQEYNKLEKEIKEIEKEIESLNDTLSEPELYQEVGIQKLSKELGLKNKDYEKKVDRFLELEEIR